MSPSEAFSIRQAPVSEADLAILLEQAGPLPSAYLGFLRETDGADDARIQPEGYVLRLYSARHTLESNVAYRIQEYLPQLWMIGDDGGDYGVCLHRNQSPPDEWPVVEVPLGALLVDEITPISPSFTIWQEAGFAVVHGWGTTDEREFYLVLEAPGPSSSRIASIVAKAAGLSIPAALTLVRQERPVLMRSPSMGLRRLERLHAELTQHGASATIHDS